MNTLAIIAIGCGGLFIIVVLAILFKLYHSISRLNASFAKLGYATREDAKKYFGDAADKVTDMNSSFYQQYQKLIEDGVRKAMSDTGTVMEGSLSKAHQEAGNVILKAQQEGQEIIASAKKDSEKYFDRAIGNSVDAIEWALEQYVHEHFDIKRHEMVVDKLLETYLNERRSR